MNKIKYSIDPAERYTQALLLYPTARVEVWRVEPTTKQIIDDVAAQWPSTEKIAKFITSHFPDGGKFKWTIRSIEHEDDEGIVPPMQVATGLIVVPDFQVRP